MPSVLIQYLPEGCFRNGPELFWYRHLWGEKEGKQIDGKYGAAEIKDIQGLTAADGLPPYAAVCVSPISGERRKTLGLI